MPSDLPLGLTAEELAALSQEDRARAFDGTTEEGRRKLRRYWPFWARPEQMPPPDDWRVWLVMAGRGFGKTRAGAEWVRGIAEQDGTARIALVGATLAEARSVMVEGESGLLAVAGEGRRPLFEPSLRRLRWATGAIATLYGAAEPEALRGPQHSHAWADEIAKWAYGEAAWANLMLGLRLGDRPRAVATTTPRPVALVRRLAVAGDVAITRGRTIDNERNLPAAFLDAVLAEHVGTRFGRQELDGELIAEVAGALWPRDLIEACRVRVAPEPARVVIGVDPPAGTTGDACGIVVAALGRDGRGYVLADESVRGASPEGWARAVALAAARFGADRVIAEANQGGAMVGSVLRAADAGLPVRLVHASHGKATRAEPVATLYERRRVSHVGAFPALEDEMAGLSMDGSYAGPGRSPDRADALVWALTALMLGTVARPGLRQL